MDPVAAATARVCRRLLTVLVPLALVVAAPLAPWVAGLRLDASTTVLLAGDARSSAAYERLTRYVGDDLLIGVLVELPELFSDDGAALLGELGDALAAIPGVDDIKSLTHSSRPVLRPGFSLDPRELVELVPFLPRDGRDADEWARLRALVLDYPLARDVFVAGDGRLAAVLIQVRPEVRPLAEVLDDVQAVADAYTPRVTSLHLLGFPFVERELTAAVASDTRLFLLAALALTLAVLLVAFRSLWVVATILVSEALGVGLVFALLELNEVTLNLYTGLLVPLVAGVQLTFLTHLFAAVQGEARRGRQPLLPAALERVGRPSVVAALTTCVGLVSLTVCDVGLVRQFGAVGAQAVALVFLVSLGPATLLAARDGGGGAVPASVPPPRPVVARWVARLVAWRVPVLALAMLLLVAALFGARQVRTDVRAVEYLGQESPSRQALELLDGRLGGLNFFGLTLDTGVDGGLHERDTLLLLEELRAFGEAQPGVTHVYAYSQVFALLNQVWERDAPGSLQLPTSDARLLLFASLVKALRLPLQSVMVDATARQAHVIVRSVDMPASAYLELIDKLVAFAGEQLPEGMQLTVQAGVHDLLAADAHMVHSQIKSLALGLGAVAVCLVLLLRSVRLGALVLAINLLPLATILGVMGLSGLPLNSVTVMVAAVALGVAVDDAIHVVAAFGRLGGARRVVPVAAAASASGADPGLAPDGAGLADGVGDEAHVAVDPLAAVLSARLRPVAATSAILTGGFLLLLPSSFPPVAHFGVLTALGLVVALGVVVVLLPALLGRRPD